MPLKQPKITGNSRPIETIVEENTASDLSSSPKRLPNAPESNSSEDFDVNKSYQSSKSSSDGKQKVDAEIQAKMDEAITKIKGSESYRRQSLKKKASKARASEAALHN